jgi:hypothetical protein
MSKASGEKASLLASYLIEEQLRVLPMSAAMILQPIHSDFEKNAQENLLLRRKRTTLKTGSGGNIVMDYAEAGTELDFQGSIRALQEDPQQKLTYLRVVVSNALLAVGLFLREHQMASMRLPEIQFLGHVVDAIMNANVFDIREDYIPIATFDDLVIDKSLNGTPLFSDGKTQGFMELGDAVALLQWLACYLRGERNFVSGGDAG